MLNILEQNLTFWLLNLDSELQTGNFTKKIYKIKESIKSCIQPKIQTEPKKLNIWILHISKKKKIDSPIRSYNYLRYPKHSHQFYRGSLSIKFFGNCEKKNIFKKCTK